MNTGDLPEAIRRLLGPGEPEVGCDLCFAELDRYVEVEMELGGAAAAAAVPGMRAHLGACPACREEYESLRAIVQHDLDGER